MRRDRFERFPRRLQDRFRSRADGLPEQFESLATTRGRGEVGDVLEQDQLERIGRRQWLQAPVELPQ